MGIHSKTVLWGQPIKDACISDPDAEADIFLESIVPLVGTLIQAASPKGESAMLKECTATAGHIATEALPSQGKYAMEVDDPNPPGAVMQDTPEVTPMGQPEHPAALEKPMHEVPINPIARDATKVKAEDVEETSVDSSEPTDLPLTYTHLDKETPCRDLVYLAANLITDLVAGNNTDEHQTAIIKCISRIRTDKENT